MMFFIVFNVACFNVDVFMGMVMRRMVLKMVSLVVMDQSQPTYPWRIRQDFNRQTRDSSRYDRRTTGIYEVVVACIAIRY